jgi:hypothetical protein
MAAPSSSSPRALIAKPFETSVPNWSAIANDTKAITDMNNDVGALSLKGESMHHYEIQLHMMKGAMISNRTYNS